MNDATPFPPHITKHAPNPGDEKSREVWELFAQVAQADKTHREAREREIEAGRALARAQIATTDAGNKLRDLHAQLTRALSLPEQMRGEPVR